MLNSRFVSVMVGREVGEVDEAHSECNQLLVYLEAVEKAQNREQSCGHAGSIRVHFDNGKCL